VKIVAVAETVCEPRYEGYHSSGKTHPIVIKISLWGWWGVDDDGCCASIIIFFNSIFGYHTILIVDISQGSTYLA
jgi:hypothetical protein